MGFKGFSVIFSGFSMVFEGISLYFADPTCRQAAPATAPRAAQCGPAAGLGWRAALVVSRSVSRSFRGFRSPFRPGRRGAREYRGATRSPTAGAYEAMSECARSRRILEPILVPRSLENYGKRDDFI